MDYPNNRGLPGMPWGKGFGESPLKEGIMGAKMKRGERKSRRKREGAQGMQTFVMRTFLKSRKSPKWRTITRKR